MAEPALPQRFGKYHVLGRLAQGGMAEIYRVKTIGIAGFEKIQALKRIRPEHARDPRFLRSFIDEARIAVALNHRNIVQVFEFGKVDDDLLLAMELIEGRNLRDALTAAARLGRPMPVALACHVLGEVASGLDYAHRRTDMSGRALGIVHCDVSPPNIALSYEGYVKILDFGVARASFAASVAGRLRGKPRYMSPEQANGETPSAATDVFALAVVAWEMLAGRYLFDEPDVDSILAAIRRCHVPSLAMVCPELPPHLHAAIDTALQADPAARGSAIDLAAAFSRAQRLLDPGVGSRQLARWLGDLFPAAAGPQAGVPQAVGEQMTRPAKAAGGTRSRRASQPGQPGQYEGAQLTPVPAGEADAATLGEKRRVLATACRLEGGSSEDRRTLRRVLADLAYKLGATVHADEPDWVMALFGLEVAGEDDVAHAARFALDAIEAARESHHPLADQAPPSVRLGMRPGTVARRRASPPGASGELTGAGGEFLLLGDALDEARTLALAAAPNRALLAGDPGRLAARHFEFREHAPLRKRGRRIKLTELVGPRMQPAAEGAVVPPGDPFHGRAAELATLSEAWSTARSENRRVTVAIIGDAGIGKSRLIAEFAARVQRENPVLLATASTPGGGETPYALALQLFATGLRLASERGAAGRARLVERLAAALRERAVAPAEADEVLATVEHALELRDGAAPASETQSANLRDRMVAAIATLRAMHRGARPRLTLIEDWHWADGASAETIKLILAGRPPPGAELVIVSARPIEGGDVASALPPGYEELITLGELPIAERTALIHDRLGAGAAPAHVALVARRAGGNPLFIEELARALAVLGPGELPESLRGVIMARVDRLPPAAKAVLQHAAVLGPVFRARLLEDLLGRGLGRARRLLEQAGILAHPLQLPGMREQLEEDAGDLAFRHGLLQEVVYDSLSGAARRDAHRRVGLILAERHEAGRPESPLAIARHLELGGEPARAAEFYLRAGRLALAAFDAREAAHALSRALDLGTTRKHEALAGRAEALFHLGDHAGQKRDLDALLTLAGDDPRRLADVLARSAARHLRLGEYAAAVAASEAAERAAEQAGDEKARGEALRVRGETFERQADFDRAQDAVARALEIFRRIGAATEETRALIGLGRIHLMGARFDAALSYYRPALERVRHNGDQWLERIIANNLSVIHLNRKEFGEALANTRRSLEICRRFGDRAREGDNCSVLSTILLELGLYDEAREWAERGLAIHAETGSRWSRADALVYAAHRETLAGDPALGIRLLEEAIALAGEIGAKYVLANARNQLAFALIRRRGPGDLLAAERQALEAAELGHGTSMPAVEIQGRSRAALARLEAGDSRGARGASTQAVQKLDQVRCIEWSEEEILHTHYRVLKAEGDPMAKGFLARAYAGLMQKLDRLEDETWRTAYAAVELHRRIVADMGAQRKGDGV